MFKTADENFADELKRFAACEPFFCRIASLYNSYPPSLSFVDYWTITENGVCSGVAARNGADYVLLLTESTDIDEVCAFLRAVGAERVLCGAQYNLNMPEYSRENGYILRKAEPYADCGNADFCVPNLKAAYKLLEKCSGKNFGVPAFEDFYVDMNHKLRHGTARIYGIEHGGELAAAALTAAECDDCAVLGAVCCLPELRRRGFASAVVKRIVNELVHEGKTVYLHRAKNENREFYTGLGFEACGMWREYFLN